MAATLKRFQELQKEWEVYCEATYPKSAVMSFEIWLIDKLDKALAIENDPENWHGHVITVRLSDLEDHFSEDERQYITELILEDIAESVLFTDADGWHEMYQHCLGRAIGDNWQDWHDIIDAEKKQRNR